MFMPFYVYIAQKSRQAKETSCMISKSQAHCNCKDMGSKFKVLCIQSYYYFLLATTLLAKEFTKFRSNKHILMGKPAVHPLRLRHVLIWER
jgi:hypothetical protein